MIRRNKKKLILTSLLILLPIAVGLLLWDRLPEAFATHWGFDGQADGFSSPAFAVFVPPLILLAVHWLCIFVTARDPKNQDRNYKPFGMVLWIIPVISNLSSGVTFALALGAEFPISSVMQAALGLLFIILGNYLPKCRQNYTIGIKVPWVYTSEENWNATHRFGGRVWMVGGLVILVFSLLPSAFGIPLILIAIVVLAAIPVIYSYLYYCRQKKQGVALVSVSAMARKRGKFTFIFTAVTLIFVAVLLFSGSIHTRFEETGFTIEASYYSSLTVDYGAIEGIELREGDVEGVRTMGFGSFRLLMGTFENAEFGSYTRYTYYAPDACVVLTVNGKILVISGRDKEETQVIYQQLLLRTEG